MSSKVLKYVAARFGFQYDQGKLKNISSGTTEATRRLRLMRREVRGAMMQFRSFLRSARSAVVYLASSQAVRAVTHQWASTADQVGKAAKGLGWAVEEFSALSEHAELSGVSLQKLQGVLGAVTGSFKLFGEKNKIVIDAFRELGVRPEDAATNKERMLMILDALSRVTDETKKQELAQAIGGRRMSQELIKMAGSTQAVTRAMEEAKRAGRVITASDYENAAAYNDALLRVKLAVRGLVGVIARRLLPEIRAVAKAMTDWLRDPENRARFLRILAKAAKAAAIAVAAVATYKIVIAFKALRLAAFAAARALFAMGAAGAFAAAKTVLIVAAIALLAKVGYELYRFAISGKSKFVDRILGFMGDKSKREELREDLLIIIARIKLAAKTLVEWGRQAIPYIVRGFRILLQVVGVIAISVIGMIKSLWNFGFALGKFIDETFIAIADRVQAAWIAVINAIRGAFRAAMADAMAVFGKVKAAWEWTQKKFRRGPQEAIKESRQIQAAKKRPLLQGMVAPIPVPSGRSSTHVTTHVGTVSVQIRGTTGMGAADVKKAVSAGVTEGLQRETRRAFATYSPAEAT